MSTLSRILFETTDDAITIGINKILTLLIRINKFNSLNNHMEETK